MEKKAILAFALSMIVFLLWGLFYTWREERIGERYNKEKATKATIEKEKVELTEEGYINGSLSSDPDLNLPIIKDIKKVDKKDIHVETDLIDIILTNEGGKIKSLRLKEYIDDNNTPLELVSNKDSDELKLPLYLESDSREITYLLNKAIYETPFEKLKLSSSEPDGTVTFSYLNEETGIKIIKGLTFHNDSYRIDVKTSISNPFAGEKGTYRIYWGPGINSGKDKKDRYSYEGPTTFVNNEKIDDKPNKIDREARHEGDVLWTALQSKYFLAALIPPRGRGVASIIRKETDNNSSGNKDINGGISIGLEFPSSGREEKIDLILYAGPKEGERLKSVELSLEKVIDYGWVRFLAVPLFWVLKFFYGFTYNYGVAIILLTIVIKVLFHPLTHMSFRSMKKMQNIQPQMKIIQERYKNDKQKMNQEYIRLYKDNKVNPMGGCLPLLLQIPVFLALYRLLAVSIELRKAPFIWWINDLSEMDPYYITPILMGVSMFIQQKMSPSPPDPTQAKITMMMPIIFTFMFLNVPAGLVLYWLVNNILSITQQYLINKRANV
ncbi:MAG: membrane protein insertase YidC [Nitrospinae bacterium]|nr:membrane protein insertase YidC [Nitrospinota bacterium]